MPHSLANVLIHLIFSTKDYLRFIRSEIETELHSYLAAVCNATGCRAHQVGGCEDHIHILFSLSRTVSISALAETVKKGSSKWLKTKGRHYSHFAWQPGYGAFSIGQSGFSATKDYILGQKEHHRRRTFKEEFLDFLAKYEVEYDERYVWD